MNERMARKLDFGRKLLLGAAGVLALALPIGFGLVNGSQSQAQSLANSSAAVTPVYQVTLLKPSDSSNHMASLFFTPSGFAATGITAQGLIQEAYGVEQNEISGAPDWLDSAHYDIDATMDRSVADELRKLSEDQRKLIKQRMLQALLAERFKLTVHSATKDLAQYALLVAVSGPKLQEAKPGDTYSRGLNLPNGLPAGPHMMNMTLGGGDATGQGLSMADLAGMLSRQLHTRVVDKTGLAGTYDFRLRWAPDGGQLPPSNGAASSPLSSDSISSLQSALQEQLGLQLQSQTGPAQIVVIDHVEEPSGI